MLLRNSAWNLDVGGKLVVVENSGKNLKRLSLGLKNLKKEREVNCFDDFVVLAVATYICYDFHATFPKNELSHW